ncbi:MAG: hypothetical protein RJQ09_09440 [Cyclobacteriaceae bacterium]
MKRIVVLGFTIATLFLGWYFLIKPYEYRIRFKVKTTSGTVIQMIKTWGATLNNSSLFKQTETNSIEQVIQIDEKSYQYNWTTEIIDDSTTHVIVYISEPTNSTLNKLKIPFTETAIESSAERTVRDFYNKMKDHLSRFRVTNVEETTFEGTFCIYIPLEASQLDKAQGMMRNFSFLSSFIAENGLADSGFPMVQVTEWNLLESTLKFDLCYPIVRIDSLPDHPLLKYKQIERFKALKADYYGNYITSDRAWYELLKEADKRGLKTTDTPIEVFHNNPNFDTNERNWKAEVFLPIK